MANALYDKAREALLTGQINWLTDDIRVALVDTGQYTVDLSADDFLDDIPVGARVAVSGASIANKTATSGVADGDDVTFASVPVGPSIEAIVIYKHTGTPSTSRLIAFIDSASSGLPVTPNGGDITVAWDNGTDRIFRL